METYRIILSFDFFYRLPDEGRRFLCYSEVRTGQVRLLYFVSTSAAQKLSKQKAQTGNKM